MNALQFCSAFEEMRSHNLGKQFERRELGLLALQYGIYFNSTMWACGLGSFFRVAKLGPKFIYSFRNDPITVDSVVEFRRNLRAYIINSDMRSVEHAKSILRRFGIRNVD